MASKALSASKLASVMTDTDEQMHLRIGDVVRTLRLQKPWTQEELGEAAGIHPTTISRIETGKEAPTRDTVQRLAKALGHSPQWLKAQADTWPAQAPARNEESTTTMHDSHDEDLCVALFRRAPKETQEDILQILWDASRGRNHRDPPAKRSRSS
jgi:transcriptional regulator with XRE-family HTH domain